MGRTLDPVYIMMKKNTPVVNMRGSCGLSWRHNTPAVTTNINRICITVTMCLHSSNCDFVQVQNTFQQVLLHLNFLQHV